MTSYRRLLEPHVPFEALGRLERYVELLEVWSRRHNLVRYRDARDLVDRHLLDALAGVELMEGARTLLDVGSGAGLPAIPLLCVRPDLRATLLEPRHKRWAFLKLVIRELGLDAAVVAARYDRLGSSDGPWDRITARALGGHDELLQVVRARLTATGAVVLWVTVDEVERLAANPEWRVVGFALPRSDRGRLAYLQPCFT